ncbi:unnamed protein product [Anisakis simplex]|uniref:Geranylgeranyl transferase type-2 subunit alpha n=1 Tax=Anisakis simplex TaxID=6269 RepID=A0A158PPD6_ANISI|nr:unnamed protein product [Anisakis simplex]
MHFVKKVPTTEEENEARQKARQSKLRAYCTIRDRVFEKREKGELNSEILELTSKILVKNPDVYTFWNVRRATISALMAKVIYSDRDENENVENVIKRNDLMLSGEMFLTEECLKENPKSYSAWFHRAWALKRMTNCNIESELKMIDKALQYDSRNFHCWDHRRFVIQLAGITPEQELKFTDQMINANFSNYSAWHYRSTLLPSVSPSDSDVILEEGTIERELKPLVTFLVRGIHLVVLQKLANAYFTDPEDQSAWKYTEWLIAMDPHSAIDESNTQVISITFYADGHNAIVLFSNAVSVEDVHHFITFPSIEHSSINYKPVSVYPMTKYARVFMITCNEGLGQAILKSSAGLVLDEIEPEEGFVDMNYLHKHFNITEKDLSTARQSALNGVIENCNALIEELSLDVNNQLHLVKRPLFTLTRCLIELDVVRNHREILKNLERLANELDTERRAMYWDLIDKYRLLSYLRTVNKSEGEERDETNLDYIIRSNQKVASTNISTVEDVWSVIESKSLQRFIFCETPLSADEEQSKRLYEQVHQRASRIRLIRCWL